MMLSIKLSDFELMALRREAKANGRSLEEMALAYLRDGIRIENAPTASRRRQYRENELSFEPLSDYDPHPNSRY